MADRSRLGWRAWNRIVSGSFFAAAVVVLLMRRGPDSAGPFLVWQPVVLLFVWFPDFFGSWIGAPPFPGGAGSKVIDSESSPFLILAFGWMILVGTFLLALAA
jgi:hypothetical protein